MNRCVNCGAELEEGAQFCAECGCKVQAPVQQNTCPKCGAALMPGARFCNKCGASIGAGMPSGAAATDTGSTMQVHARPIYQQQKAEPTMAAGISRPKVMVGQNVSQAQNAATGSVNGNAVQAPYAAPATGSADAGYIVPDRASTDITQAASGSAQNWYIVDFLKANLQTHKIPVWIYLILNVFMIIGVYYSFLIPESVYPATGRAYGRKYGEISGCRIL